MGTTYSENLSVSDRRVRDHYQEVADQVLMTSESRFMNMGFWETPSLNLDGAARALCRLVAEVAEIGNDDRVLDVGCGFGDQDKLWLEEYTPSSIDAINISEYQIDTARSAKNDWAMSDRLNFAVASATDIPFDDGQFSKVLCVESAHHFDTRQSFFHEAYRVLKTDGLLVTTDLIVHEGRGVDRFSRNLILMPSQNVYPLSVYKAKLIEAGFGDVEVRSIAPNVFTPFAGFLARRFTVGFLSDHPRYEFLRRIVRNVFLLGVTRFGTFDYVIAKGRRLNR